MQSMSEVNARQWLRQQGVMAGKWLDDVVGGFDFEHYPVYVQHLFADEVIYQYIRNPGHSDLNPDRGSWFCLKGSTPYRLAISEGVAGRRLHEFRVKFALTALEGVAARKAIDWNYAIGGGGGGTQLFIPPFQIARICAVTPAERW